MIVAKLYYGNGNCTIEGSGIRLVFMKYRGAIEIDDKTSPSFVINERNNRILIFRMGKGTLNNLFDYVGEFKILSVVAINSNSEKAPTTIHRVMDYTELLNTKAEDMTTLSEDLSSTYTHGRKVAKTILKQPYIPNLHTSTDNVELFFKDGTPYKGSYHIHLADNAAMTGNEHTEESQDLYYSTGKPTRNTGLPHRVIEEKRQRKMFTRKKRRR